MEDMMSIDELDEAYETVGRELVQGKEHHGLMARAVAESDGDPDKAKSIYIRYRAAEIATKRKQVDCIGKTNENELDVLVDKYGAIPEVIQEAREHTVNFDDLTLDKKLEAYKQFECPETLCALAFSKRFTDEKKDLDGAVLLYQKVLERFPTTPEARYVKTQLDGLEKQGLITIPSTTAQLVSQVCTPIENPLFLFIPIPRLIFLSIFSMGIYEVYWIYKNWKYIQIRSGSNISPFWRGVFGLFYCHSLLKYIHEDQESRSIQQPSFSAGGLATGWLMLVILANIVSRAPGIGASIIAAFIPSYLCLLPVQRYINEIERKRNPTQAFHGWSTGHIICILIGTIIWGSIVVALS
jgi:hypothetical protein